MKTNGAEFKKMTAYFFYKFISGSLSVFGLTNPVTHPKIITGESNPEEDAYNIYCDWENVGKDINHSYE
jgi:hypothetical protein